jgi:membrane protease subunit HflC
MNRIKQIVILAVLAIGTYVLINSVYTVSEVEQVIITQFGKPVGAPVTSAGLKFKLPFIQDVNPIDKRVLEWDGRPSDMPTKDKLYISVDLFARWRITAPLQYFLRLRDERSAQSRLDDILGSETRNAVAKHELIEIIRTTKDRVPLRDTLLTDAEKKLKMGSLVPIQKGRKLVEQEIFAAAAKEGTRVWYRIARYPVQAHQLQQERTPEDLRTDDQRTAADCGTLSLGRKWRGCPNPRQSRA